MTETQADAPVLGRLMAEEIESQPDMWSRAAAMRQEREALPADGARLAVVGCGTSWFIAQAYAALREGSGRGVTDAFAASEAPLGRRYDAILAITRSGTTTEVLELLDRAPAGVRTVALIGDPQTPVVELAQSVIALPFADERSVVQTRFATTALAFLRAGLGEDLAPVVEDAARAVAAPLAPRLTESEQFTFLGRGWSVGIAHEAALKMREASQSWTESYPAMEYRHGPISIAAPDRVTWLFGPAPSGLAEDVAATGAWFEHSGSDAMADLIRAQRVALERARRAGLDPDRPRNLTRSVILG